MRDPDDHPSRAELSADAHEEAREAAQAAVARLERSYGGYETGIYTDPATVADVAIDAYLEALNAH